jgi:CMP-N-acetylneuraminate monooxygenase
VDSFEFQISEDFFADRPKRLELTGGTSCFVVTNEGQITSVLKDKCSHMGGSLTAGTKGFACRTHGWLYDKSGKNLTPTNPGLTNLDFVVEGNKLTIFQKEAVELLPFDGAVLDGSEELELLAHASFILKVRDCQVLFDPWFTGDAYWGSWRLWPENPFSADKLKALTHVIVTHPHPDHFNVDSLKLLDRSVQFFFPEFVSRIIPETLKSLGFKNLNPVHWESRVEISPDVTFAFLRPNTLWEDSAVLVRVGDWLWLNQSDAGAPLDDSLVPHGLDLLSSTFDPGASGYPLTYDLPTDKKLSIVRNSKQQMLTAISQRCESVGAKHFAPFAGWWRHCLDEHQLLAEMLEHVTLEDLELLFSAAETRLLPTIPSSRINLKSMDMVFDSEVAKSMSLPVEVSSLPEYTSKLSDEQLFVSVREVLGKLASNSKATRSEDVIFSVTIEGLQQTVETRFGDASSDPVRIQVSIPRRIAELIVGSDRTVTWNHIDIGYWGRWSRDSDRYPSNFMRLLQLGYVPEFKPKGEALEIDAVLAVNVAHALETAPDVVSKILARAGLPCVSCQHSLAETLESALNIHKVGAVQREVALAELSVALGH